MNSIVSIFSFFIFTQVALAELTSPAISHKESSEVSRTDTLLKALNFEYSLPKGHISWLNYFKYLCSDLPEECVEEFQGPPPADNLNLDGVKTRISKIKIEGKPLCCEYNAKRDALKVEILLTTENSEQIIQYFKTGFSEAAVRQRVQFLLGSKRESWIEVQEIFPNWLRDRANTFPITGDHDVCHALSRQFFASKFGDGASTDALGITILENYRFVEKNETHQFGDLIYKSSNGSHSGRFILTDPVSGRGISMSLNSGGYVPIRFWWIDEDFAQSGSFSGVRDQQYLDHTNIYRRCKSDSSESC